MKLQELKKGTFFTFKPCEYPSENIVWVKGDYDRSSKKYSVYKFADVNHESFRKGTTEVFTDFIF